MARYKLSNALRSTDVQEFENAEIAWNTLRKTFERGHFMWLYKEMEIEIPINNEVDFVEHYNSKYGPRPIGYGDENAKLMKVGEKHTEKFWVPILLGLTSHEYSVNKE